MREPPPHLTHESLTAALLDHFGIMAAVLTFLPLGHDAAAWVYRARAIDGAEYFVKVRSRLPNEADLRVPRYLLDLGITQVVAPLPALAGELSARIEHYALVVYPYLAGASGWGSGVLSDEQWHEYGAILRRIHNIAVPPAIAHILPREEYHSPSIELVRRVDSAVETIAAPDADYTGREQSGDPVAQAMAAFWLARRDEIRGLLARVEELGERLARAAPPFVLTHGDIHTGNVHLDEQGRVWIVDWDETALAPKERDLMFVVGGIHSDLVGAREEALFFEGYGTAALDPLALAYYRYLWAVQDVGAFGEQVLLLPDAGEVTRREGLEGLMAQFAPGGIVSIARASRLAEEA